MPSRIHTFPSGRRVALVPRDQLRAGRAAKRTRTPRKGSPVPPAPPASWDNSKGETITYQCYCNGPPWPDPEGDCYYEGAIHGASNWTGQIGSQFVADPNAVSARYLQISGGDNGLSDSDMMPEWTGGIVGPSGARKILDYMVVTAAPGSAQWQQLMWMFGGLIWTCSLCEEWLDNDTAGTVWDAGTPDPDAGHAMFETGRHSSSGPSDTRTWGITPPIQVTDAGYASADSEFIVLYSADQFNPQTGMSVFSGMTWEDSRQYWIAIGGKDVGPSPFSPTPPVPPVPPVPPPPAGGWSGSLTYAGGALMTATAATSAPVPPVGVTPPPVPTTPTAPAGPALPRGVLDDVAALVAAIEAEDWPGVGTSLAQLLADLLGDPTSGQYAALSAAMQRRVSQTRQQRTKKKG